MKNEKGVALIIVLWIALLLSTIAVGFAYTTRLKMKLSSYHRDEFLCLSLARAGVEHQIAKLANDETQRYDTSEEWAFEDKPFDLGDGSYQLSCRDEESKLNINTEQEASFKNLPGLEQEIIDAILDWRDKDSLCRLNGAEDSYYKRLDPPYECKDGDFDTVEELLLVKGITRGLLYGEDRDGDGRLDPGLIEHLTVATDGRININTASKQVLRASLGIDPDLAENIIDYRKDTPFKNREELLRVKGIKTLPQSVKDRLLKKVSVASSVFTITSIGTLKDGQMSKRIKAVVDRSASPLRIVYWQED